MSTAEVGGKRNLNLDLLRIVSMLMILTIHFLGKGGLLSAYPILSKNYMFVWSIETICNIGVNCFVLISGYFLIKSTFKLKKLFALVGEVVFYTFFIYMLFIVFGHATLNLSDLTSSLLPVLTGQYWFISAYVGLYILSPFLNQLIARFKRKEHLRLSVLLIVIFSVWPTLIFFGSASGLQGYYLNSGFSVFWMIILYIIAAYLSLYYKPDYEFKRHLVNYCICAIVSVVALLGSIYLAAGLEWSAFTGLQSILNNYNSLTVLICSVAFFILFLNTRISSELINKGIKFFAPLTLAVYLIHEEPHVRIFLWEHLKVTEHAHGLSFVLFAAASILGIYLLCSLIDWMRIKVFNWLSRSAVITNVGNKLEGVILGISQNAVDRFKGLL